MKYNTFFNFNSSFKTFFHVSGSGFFRIGSGFVADPDPDPDSEEKADPDLGKKNRIRNTAMNTRIDCTNCCPILCSIFWAKF